MLSNVLRYGAVALFGIFTVTISAQTPPAVTLPLAGVHYRYWPEQIIQWIGPELPYSMIVLDIDDRGKQPVYDVALIDKSGQKATHYTNSAAELALDQRIGFTVHQVAMAFDGPADPVKGAQYLLRFNTEAGVPVVWQFILGSDVTEQGSGVSPLPGAVPVLLYREQGGVAAEGTALRVGSVTSTADLWTEIAQPPYFIPYHGALSTGVHVLSFAPGSTAWKAEAQTLTDPAGLALAVTKDGDTLTMTNKLLGTSAVYTESGSNSISRVAFGPVDAKRDHTVSLEFAPALAANGESSFAVIAGKKTRIAGGTVQSDAAPAAGSNQAAGAGQTWIFTSPDPLRSREVKAVATLQP
jgi:hypothetical protein